MKQDSWLGRNPITGYFGFAFAASWCGILVVLGASKFDPVALGPGATALIFVLMLLGPCGSGLALTAWTEGKTGLRRLAISHTGWLLVLYPATSFEQGLLWQSAFAVGLGIAAGLASSISSRGVIDPVLPALDLPQAPVRI
jgi:hypothetical protein